MAFALVMVVTAAVVGLAVVLVLLVRCLDQRRELGDKRRLARTQDALECRREAGRR